ncbi:hypothetical protein BCV72DRAFT_202246, partial [Rhizopus microsporus var. microsporus]
KSLKVKGHLEPVNNEVMNAYQRMHITLNDEGVTMGKAEEAIDEIKLANQTEMSRLYQIYPSNF